MNNNISQGGRRNFLKSAGLLSAGACLATNSGLISCVQNDSSASEKHRVRDRFWIFTDPAGTDDHRMKKFGVKGGSRMTPAESAYWLGVHNILFIRDQGLPAYPDMETDLLKSSYEQYAMSFEPLDRVIWSIVGSGGIGSAKELPYVLDMAKKFPNISGVFLDDFIINHSEDGKRSNIGKPALSKEELSGIRERFKEVNQKMEMWVTLYTHHIFNEGYSIEPPLSEYIDLFDVATLWTWKSEDLPKLEENLANLEKLTKGKTKIGLGIYTWDYTTGQSITNDLMEFQCGLGLKWLKEKRIENMIFLGNTLFDMGFPSVDFIRKWIAKVGNEIL